MIVKTLKALGWVTGFALIGLGVGRIFFPSETMPGAGEMSATMDSETRAAGALLIAMGAGYLWAVRQTEIPVAAVRFLAASMGLLALTRVVSIVAVGMPDPVFAAAAGVEFAAAALTWWYSCLGARRR
ncbi:DUF4345 domain-containing protein [Mycolicibacterium brumae]|nr:DUF4345 domain-containing protein [Mycolicibacterium brumae]MCV7191470.1 DUF4345 domain-containing protein [Mycolicibacterium brumae]UWW09423.1 DUF4345 domain-containing protein [Mycolicibacterium brumae]